MSGEGTGEYQVWGQANQDKREAKEERGPSPQHPVWGRGCRRSPKTQQNDVGRGLAPRSKAVPAAPGQPAGHPLVWRRRGAGRPGRQCGAGARAQWSGSTSSTQGQAPGSLSHMSSPKAELSGQPARPQSEGVVAPPGLDSCRGTESRAQRRQRGSR